ncbi:MAG: SDR family oxidoreductase [Microthrixaceae bacterium]
MAASTSFWTAAGSSSSTRSTPSRVHAHLDVSEAVGGQRAHLRGPDRRTRCPGPRDPPTPVLPTGQAELTESLAVIADALSAKRIFITGATGFVGTALTERILRCVPESTVVLLVRDGRRRDARSRVEREVLRNDAFDRLRDELGKDGFADMAQRRVEVVAGDVGTDRLGLDAAGLQALSTCDVVIHSAATVAFDAPLDRAVEVNLLGPVRIARTIDEAFGTHGRPVPHLVTVSTCYVAGNRRGAAPEEPVRSNPFFVDIDWQAEVAAARRTRADTDAASRHPDRLAEFAKTARSVLGPAGGPALSERTEQLRRDWVADSLVSAGRSRAASLGWPDAYALTKALGEVALGETLDGIRAEGRRTPTLSVVRPSIIESALAEPSPGWIRGFRMAEPIILSYARGLLKEFPGVPEGIVDVIPVDLVDRRSSLLPPTRRGSRPPTSSRSHPVASTRCSTRCSWTMCATGSSNTRCTTTTASRSWCRTGPFPGGVGWSASCVWPRAVWNASSGSSATCRCAAGPPGGEPNWSSDAPPPNEPCPTSSCTAPTPSARPSTGSTACSSWRTSSAGRRWRRLTRPDAAGSRAIEWDDYIPRIHLPSVVKHGRAATTGAKATPSGVPTGCAARSSPNNVTSRRSTWRTR